MAPFRRTSLLGWSRHKIVTHIPKLSEMFENSKEISLLSIDESTSEDEMLYFHKATSVADCTLTSSYQRTLSVALIWKHFALNFIRKRSKKVEKTSQVHLRVN